MIEAGRQREMASVVAACLPRADAGAPGADGDVLGSWAKHLVGRARNDVGGCLRFAFFGRVSTEDWQDPVTSRARQLQQAALLVSGHGVITAEFFGRPPYGYRLADAGPHPNKARARGVGPPGASAGA